MKKFYLISGASILLILGGFSIFYPLQQKVRGLASDSSQPTIAQVKLGLYDVGPNCSVEVRQEYNLMENGSHHLLYRIIPSGSGEGIDNQIYFDPKSNQVGCGVGDHIYFSTPGYEQDGGLYTYNYSMDDWFRNNKCYGRIVMDSKTGKVIELFAKTEIVEDLWQTDAPFIGHLGIGWGTKRLPLPATECHRAAELPEE